MRARRQTSKTRSSPILFAAFAALLLYPGCGDIIGEAISPPKDAGESTATDPKSPASLVSVPIVFNDEGWISNDSNNLGIQGSWHYYAGRYSTIAGSFEDGDTVFASGTVAPPPDGEDYVNYFGAKIGFHICAVAPTTAPDFQAYTANDCPYNKALADQIVGVIVTVDGLLPSTELRLQLSEKDRVDGTYAVLNGSGRHIIIFSDTKVHYNTNAEPFHIDAFNGILFFISSAGGPSDFSMRIRDLEFLVAR